VIPVLSETLMSARGIGVWSNCEFYQPAAKAQPCSCKPKKYGKIN
jgi:hypothetical protein